MFVKTVASLLLDCYYESRLSTAIASVNRQVTKNEIAVTMLLDICVATSPALCLSVRVNLIKNTCTDSNCQNFFWPIVKYAKMPLYY